MAYRSTKDKRDTPSPFCAEEQLPKAQHERFAQLVAAERNVTDAYSEVYPGSSRDAARANGARLIANDNIRRRAEHLSATVLERAITAAAVTKERVLTELARIAFTNMGDYLAIGPDGEPRIDLSRLGEDQWAAVAEVTIEITGTHHTVDGVMPARRTKLKLVSKLPALEQLARNLQLFDGGGEASAPDAAKQDAQREKSRRLMLALLDAKARRRLPPEVDAALESWAEVPDNVTKG